jgi:hypothetical protein
MKNRSRTRDFLLQGAAAAWRFGKIGFLLYAVEFLLAWIPLSTLHAEWSRLLGHSLSGEAVLKGFGADFFVEFAAHHPDTVSAALLTLAISAGAALLLGLFFSGGLIACFIEPGGNGFPFFFENSARFFGRFTRLFLISLPFLAATIAAWSLLHTALLKAAGGSEPLAVVFSMMGMASAAVLVLLIDMVLDYAKIITVREGRRDMLRTALMAFRFVRRNRAKTAGLYAVIGAAGLAGSLLFMGMGRLADVPSGAGLCLLFICQQADALFRTAVRMEFLSAQTALFKSLQPRKRRKV